MSEVWAPGVWATTPVWADGVWFGMGGEAPAVVTGATAVPTYGERRRKKKKRKDELAQEIRNPEPVIVVGVVDGDAALREFIASRPERASEPQILAARPEPVFIDRTAEIQAARDAARRRRIKIFLLLNTE
jgi:hypothetical protein